MAFDVGVATAFVVGLLGSMHCVAMCGGIVGALTLGVRRSEAAPRPSLFPYLLAYNAGRIASYAAAGALMGSVGAQFLGAAPDERVQRVGALISAAFTLALGLYFADLWRGLAALERAGAYLWKRIEPLGRTLLPVNHPGKALLFGAVWGWLPCGLVFSMLAWSLAAGSGQGGALIMASFGLGTLPMLVVMGSAARWLNQHGRVLTVRRGIGWLLIFFAVYLFFIAGAVTHVHQAAP